MREDDRHQQHNNNNGRSNRGKITGFHVFRSEYLRDNPVSSDADGKTRKMHLMTCSRVAGTIWKDLSREERRAYKEKANAHNTVVEATKKAAAEEVGLVENNPPPRTSKRSGFHLFRSEYHKIWKMSNPNASPAERNISMITCCREAGAHWRGMTAVEKSAYNDRAAMEDGSRVSKRKRMKSRSGGGEKESGIIQDGANAAKRSDAMNCRKRTSDDLKNDVNGVSHDEGDVGGNVRDDRGGGKSSRKDDEGQGIVSGSSANMSSESNSENWFGENGPTKYGNCIFGFHCQCQYCSSRSPASFIVHPSGDDLSSLSISRVSLPRDPLRHDGRRKQEVVIGSRILQISRCGSATLTMGSSNPFYIVARTSQYCSVIYAKSTISTLEAEEACSNDYHLREETRIDLRSSPCRSIDPFYLPVYLSCDPKATDSSFTFPTFAILSCDCAGNSTTIHRVVLRREPVVKCHSISSSLSDISLIEFCSDSRMAVWAAARSRVTPKLSTGLFKGGTSIPMTGYGHSLFRIDLTNDSSSLVWSPSHAEFLTEGLHSINGIKTDAAAEHVVWVSSSSACKVWALDVRHKLAKIVVSWSLPLLSDDFGSQSALTGIYGGGIIMSQPISPTSSSNKNRNSSIQIHPTPMFSLKKDYNSNALCIYQFPCANPRLGTRPLESVGFQYVPKSHYEVSSIARSAIFPLPDAGGSIFNVGLAAFHYSPKTCLSTNQLSQLGSQTTPMNVIYVITMTSIGDLYSHSLLEFNGAEETQARQFIGLPVGSKVIPVPCDLEAKAKTLDTGQLTVSLSNEFPTPSNAISPYIIQEAGDCCTFKSYDVGDILSHKPKAIFSLQGFGQRDSPAVSGSAADQAAVSNAPSDVLDSVDSNAAPKAAAFNNSCTRLTSHGLHKIEETSVSIRYSIEHSPPKFGVVLSSESPNQLTNVVDRLIAPTGSHSHPISVHFSQTAAVTHNDHDAVEYNTGYGLSRVIGAPDKQRNSEIDIGLIMALKSSYYSDEKAISSQHIGVKSEWNSDYE
ncbi:hypothetical protein ACHAXA_011108 [Cyclostephanos tholiformis]|uniref:HMG box domain-containing protein n=1 Tax=Cyclostephanos tholiformis TaxID=382380 RepID=A0ABD3SES4_9STRA